ncbi:hypothetical protein H8F18_14605 [Vibrio fluvialis]|uniref:Uncharacterized protein n=2 Tax=Vibrio TaxID=662 RepID=A0A7Z7VKX6_VIBCL|nr:MULTISPECIES: hypothetical protein [Vibrio]MBL4243665.1 hypothetical protein [Vibrio fluvialis]MBL4252502.1 hypothetical protein [Vibrio fluvialis]TBM35700.1 hypothetical protein EYB64_20585 [Vibrio cholerae]BEI26414.1 hypothetical protein KKIDH5335_47460 [Vibrio fluvialis]
MSVRTDMPDWANDMLICKGLGFEVQGLSECLWREFCAQFGLIECKLSVRKDYFAHYIKQQIRSGGITNKISKLKAQQKAAMGQNRNYHYAAPRPRKSMLQEFEEKYAEYLRDE